MTNRGRGFMSGGVWDGEYDSQSIVDIKARLDALETPTVPGGTTTLTGTPQKQGLDGSPGSGQFALASRVDSDGLVYVTLQFTSLASTLRRFWIYLRKVKSNGSYGKEFQQRVIPTAADIANNHIEVEVQKGLISNKRYDLVRVEAKLTDDGTNDGGNRDQDPDPYTAATGPNGAGGGSPQLGYFLTGAAQAGVEAENEALNSKFNWSRNTWNDDGGPADQLAKWRHGQATAVGGNAADPIVANTTSTARNYWSKAAHFFNAVVIQAGTLVIYRGATAPSIEDCCARLQGRPFDAGEPFNVQWAMMIVRNFSGFDSTLDLAITLEDSSVGVIASTTFTGINAPPSDNVYDFKFLRAPETFVSASYSPAAASQQWVRFRLSGTFTATRLVFDKVSVGHMAGAYKPNPRDKEQTQDPDITSRLGTGRGQAGYGRTGQESPSTGGGQITRPSTD